MRIITWNCNGALRNKISQIDSFNADILIIQECDDPAHSTSDYRKWAGDYLWVGSSKNKGLGVFSKKGNIIKELDWHGTFKIDCLKSKSPSLKWSASDLKLFLPFNINDKFNLLGVWTKGSDAEVFSYIGQLWKYLQIHRKELSKENTMIIGDLNSNSIWDKPDRWWSHSSVVNEMKDIGLESLYHYHNNEIQGNESVPTFFLHRKANKPYHIDYVFCSKNVLNTSKLFIGDYVNWIDISDHMPLCLDIIV